MTCEHLARRVYRIDTDGSIAPVADDFVNTSLYAVDLTTNGCTPG